MAAAPADTSGHTAWHMRRHIPPRTTGTPVGDLLATLRAEGAAQGLALYRYNRCREFTVTIGYALHPADAEVEPPVASLCSGPRVVLTQREGTTPRCQAYRELTKLLAELRAIPGATPPPAPAN